MTEVTVRLTETQVRSLLDALESLYTVSLGAVPTKESARLIGLQGVLREALDDHRAGPPAASSRIGEMTPYDTMPHDPMCPEDQAALDDMRKIEDLESRLTAMTAERDRMKLLVLEHHPHVPGQLCPVCVEDAPAKGLVK